MKRILLIAVMIVLCYPAICFSQVCLTKDVALAFRSEGTMRSKIAGNLTNKQLKELIEVGEVIPLKGGIKVINLNTGIWVVGIKGRIAGSGQVFWFCSGDLNCD